MISSLLDFTNLKTGHAIDERYRRVLEAVTVYKLDSARLSLEVSTVNDWWVLRVSSDGPVRFHGDLPRGALKDRASLTQVISGDCRMHSDQAFFGAPGELCLSQWNNFDDVTLTGVVNYLALYLPVSDMERASGGQLPYERFIPGYMGAGAVLASAMRQWIDEALSDRDIHSLENISESLLRMTLEAFTNPHISNPFPEDRGAHRFRAILNYIQMNYSDPELTPASAAKNCGVSLRQLYRDFSDQGEKFSSRLMNARLTNAANALLRDPEATISDISRNCGFTSATHFSRVFRKSTGNTPSEYREHHREHHELD